MNRYFCGWDGGGTKTRVCVTDEAGTVLCEAEYGPLNMNGADMNEVLRTISDCVSLMADQAGGLCGCAGLVIGMAGISSIKAVRLTEEAIASCGYQGPLRLLGDDEIALAAAVTGPGAVLIAGTGSVCCARDRHGKTFRCGGYGWLIDDGGSGYAIGRDILAAVSRAWDGRQPPTCLTDALHSHFGISSRMQLIQWLCSPETDKKRIASAAKLLPETVQLKDAAALAIAERASAALAELVVTAFRQAGLSTGQLALCGSVFTYHPYILCQVVARVRAVYPGITVITEPGMSPAQGAAKLARELFGGISRE